MPSAATAAAISAHPLDRQHRLAADDHQRPLRPRQRMRRGDRPTRCGACGRDRPPSPRAPTCASPPANMRSACRFRYQRSSRSATDVPLPAASAYHCRISALVVQQVDRAFDEHRPRHAVGGQPQRLLDRDVRGRATRLTWNTRLTCGATSGFWSMSCSAPRPCSAVGAAPPSSSSGLRASCAFLSAVIVLVEPGPRGDRRDARRAGQPRHRVGGEDRGRLVARVDDADAARLGRRQDRRDVAAAQCEQHRHAVRAQHCSDRARRRSFALPRASCSATSTLKSILPTRVLGNSRRNSISRGHDHLISRSRQMLDQGLRGGLRLLRRVLQHDHGLHPLDLRLVRHADHAGLEYRGCWCSTPSTCAG